MPGEQDLALQLSDEVAAELFLGLPPALQERLPVRPLLGLVSLLPQARPAPVEFVLNHRDWDLLVQVMPHHGIVDQDVEVLVYERTEGSRRAIGLAKIDGLRERRILAGSLHRSEPEFFAVEFADIPSQDFFAVDGGR